MMVFGYNPKGWYLQCFVTPEQKAVAFTVFWGNCMHKTNVNISKCLMFSFWNSTSEACKNIRNYSVSVQRFLEHANVGSFFSRPFAENWKDDTSQAILKEDARWKFPGQAIFKEDTRCRAKIQPSNTKRRCGVNNFQSRAMLKEDVVWVKQYQKKMWGENFQRPTMLKEDVGPALQEKETHCRNRKRIWVQVGWMCNHLRHVTAQFLIEHLDLSWKDGLLSGRSSSIETLTQCNGFCMISISLLFSSFLERFCLVWLHLGGHRCGHQCHDVADGSTA